MIVIKLVGGLASQLHKYAVAKSIAERYSKKLKVDLSAYESMEENNVMYYGLPNIGFNPLVANEQDLSNAKGLTRLGNYLYFIDDALREIYFFNRLTKKILNKIESRDITRGMLYKNFLKIHISDSTSLDWIEDVGQSKNCYVAAEFGLRFDIIDSIRNELREKVINANISNRAEIYLKKIKESPVSISLHVRRGDYVTNKNANIFHGVCDESYYRKALKRYEATQEAQVFIFSDDIEWVKKEYRSFLPEKTVFISHNENYEDFILMTNCSHHIIANSGFSSIAAWLSGSYESNIISPARWFIHEETNQNQMEMLPKGWVYI